jgi:hypothetical protein
VKSKQEQKVKEGARQFLEDGEEIVATIVARPRGFTQQMAGSMMLGSSQQSKVRAAAEAAGIELASPMAVAMTQRRLLMLELGSTVGMGVGGSVKQLLSSVPIADVDSIELKRLALGKVVKLTIRGSEIKLETNAMADAKGLVKALESARAVAA